MKSVREQRLEDALNLIRYRYFPVDDDARVEWARQTFQIAHDALEDGDDNGE